MDEAFRTAFVYVRDSFAGVLRETDEGYVFQYDAAYLSVPQNPAVSVGDRTLVSGTDYSVAYANNTKAGTATVTITGKGNYTGTKSATFKISPAAISGAAISGLAAKTYTGKALTQTPVVKIGSATLKTGTDYTVSYKNNVNAGTATVTITAAFLSPPW